MPDLQVPTSWPPCCFICQRMHISQEPGMWVWTKSMDGTDLGKLTHQIYVYDSFFKHKTGDDDLLVLDEQYWMCGRCYKAHMENASLIITERH